MCVRVGQSSNPYDVESAKKVISKATSDGIFAPQERKEVFEIGRSLDEKSIQDLKQGIDPKMFADVLGVLDAGHDSVDTAAKIAQFSAKSVEFKTKAQLTDEASGGVAKAGKNISNFGKSVESAGANSTSSSAITRKAAGSIAGAVDGIGKAFKDIGIPDVKENMINQTAVEKGSLYASKSAESFMNNKVKSVQKDFEKKEAAGVNCVPESLKDMGYDVEVKGAVNANTETLKGLTGKEWKNLEPSKVSDKYNDVALAVVGNHAMVLKDVVGQNLVLHDPVADKDKIVNANNPALKLFAPKDENIDSLASKRNNDVEPLPFKEAVGKLKNQNIQDKTLNSNNESWEVRKAFIMMGDPAEAASVKKLVEAVKSGSTQDISKVLNSKGIKLDDREINAMKSVLNAKLPENGKTVTMADKLLQVSSLPKEKSDNFLKAVEYSDVNLNNYFSSASSATERASNMLENLKAMLEGKDGC